MCQITAKTPQLQKTHQQKVKSLSSKPRLPPGGTIGWTIWPNTCQLALAYVAFVLRTQVRRMSRDDVSAALKRSKAVGRPRLDARDMPVASGEQADETRPLIRT